MKYTRMLCWLSQKDKVRLKSENKNYKVPLYISKNFEDFVSQISEDDYIVLSCNSLSKKFKKTIELVRKHNDKTFHIFARLDDSNIQNELTLICEPNVVDRQYGRHELFEDFLGRFSVPRTI
jgi:hypothetical protein